MKVHRNLTIFVLIFGFITTMVAGNHGSIESYIKQICNRIPIHTTVPKTNGDNGFRIIIQGLPSSDSYKPGETYTVSIHGSSPSQHLLGVMVEATAEDKMGSIFVPGTFDTSSDGRIQDLKDDKTCDKSIVAHRYLMKKNGVTFKWTAPVSGVGCVHFNATVIEHSDVWFKDDGNLHRVICDDSAQQDLANAVNNDPPSHPEDECCACGHATYAVEFQGLWSRNTHPKGFPDEKNAFQLHWSNVVGATHGNNYRIWDYGRYASRAVKEVCEFGSSRSLENEMKENSGKIRTVIKTKQLWGPVAILDTLKAVYTASKEKHLLSLLTMIGPSPDWCLGVSALSMCTRNCSWVDNLSIDLYPWDSGTDSRLTYLGRKIPTLPPELIHHLNSTYPKNAESPFYGVDLKPLARLTITKNKETCTDDDGTSNSAENSPTTDELASMMKKNLMMKKQMEMEKCATSEWSDWTECSNSCGSGTKQRRRMLKNPGMTLDMCPVVLEESQECTGDCRDTRRKKLNDNFVMRHDDVRDPSDMCAVTGWSDWSPCSSTCGLGMKERWRMFLHGPEKRSDCGLHLMEKDLCRGEISDCQKAMMMKNFTAICQLTPEVGPCRGNFPRWFYNNEVQKCQRFIYGGCRGNENKFELEDECVNLCADHMANIHRKEQMLQKQEMMDKQMEIDKQMEMEKQRMMEKQKAMEEEKQMMMKKFGMETGGITDEEDDVEFKNAMMKKQMSNNRDNDNNEMMKNGDEVATNGFLTKKQQMMLNKKKNRKMLRNKQLLEDYDDEDDDEIVEKPVIDCMMTPWTDWSECSVTCGAGMSMKTREIKVEAQNGGRKCQGKLVKKKKCRQKKCAVDCVMGEWSEWSSCSETCGNNAVQVRKRPRIQRPLHGGLACPDKMEKKFCNVPMCTGPNAQNTLDNMRKADFFIS